MKPQVKEVLEWVYCIIIAVILALIFRYYIGTPTIVKQISMNPTLEQNQRLWLNRWGRTTKTLPQRGDIITFEAPAQIYTGKLKTTDVTAKFKEKPKNIFSSFMYYVVEVGKDSYIKRVIGLPGEHVKIENGKVYINDKELEEPYLPDGLATSAKVEGLDDFTVPENTVFAMGDNREHSTDCREFGCIPLEKIESKVAIRIWPLNLWGKVE